MIDELAIASLLLSALALISCLSVADKRRIRRVPRAAWVPVILFVPLVGSVLWFGLGRPHRSPGSRTGWRAVIGVPEPPHPPAPDDDPDFLRSLGQPPPDGGYPPDPRREQERRTDPGGDG